MAIKQQQNGFARRLTSLFNGRSTFRSQILPSSAVSPKSPAPRLGVSILSSPRIDLPGLPSCAAPSSLPPVSPYSNEEALSPPLTAIAAPASVYSSRDQPSTLSPSTPSAESRRHPLQSNWQWEHVRDSSGNTRRRRKRLREHVRPRGAKKGILQEKAGRLKLIRCLGLGFTLAVGLSICRPTIPHCGKTTDNPTRSGAGLIRHHPGSPGTHTGDRRWTSSCHGIRARNSSPMYVHTTASSLPS